MTGLEACPVCAVYHRDLFPHRSPACDERLTERWILTALKSAGPTGPGRIRSSGTRATGHEAQA